MKKIVKKIDFGKREPYLFILPTYTEWFKLKRKIIYIRKNRNVL